MNTRDVFFRVMNLMHRAVLRASGGRLGGTGLGMPVLELTTTGRRSGQERTVLLTAPLRTDDEIVIVASKGGDARNPAWFWNLSENPDVTVRIEGVTRPMRARAATGTERDELWARITAEHDNYAGYQRRTDRVIPVVVLGPRP